MEYTFTIDNCLKFDISQQNNMKFEIKGLPEKEYIEKEITPYMVSVSADAFPATDLVSAVFRTEEKEDNMIHGN